MSKIGPGTPIEVFCSYAHTDEASVHDVLRALGPFVESGLLTLWLDRQISAGREWMNEIDLYLNTAHIILLFTSPAFLASRYCTNVELPRALERAHRREAHVIPVLLEPIDLSSTAFGHLQALPPTGKPIGEWSITTEATRAIAMHIEDLAHQLVEARTRQPAARARLLNLPSHRNPYFTGREEVLEHLHRSLHQHHTSTLVQAITGLGGSARRKQQWNMLIAISRSMTPSCGSVPNRRRRLLPTTRVWHIYSPFLNGMNRSNRSFFRRSSGGCRRMNSGCSFWITWKTSTRCVPSYPKEAMGMCS